MTRNTGTITKLHDWREESKSDSQSTRASDRLFSTEPDHEKTKTNEVSKVQSYGEDKLSTESLNTLKMEEVEHSKHKIIDQGQKAIQQTPELQQQWTPSTTIKTSRLVPLETKTIPEYKKDLEGGSHMSHLAGRLSESPFTGTDYQEVGLREKLDVDVIT